jgi:hypothetical protein
MDAAVVRSLAKWPDVPAVYGWLELDRRGNWLIRGERIQNMALREFIGRNYAADPLGRWYFQNGPQRVYVKLAYTPRVVHYEGDALRDQCGNAFQPAELLVDDEGSVLMRDAQGVALLDDRDLARHAESGAGLPLITRAEVPGRFGFIQDPRP